MLPYWMDSLVGVITLGAEVGLVAVVVLWFFRQALPGVEALFQLLGQWWAAGVAGVSIAAIVMSLIYEAAGFTPCFWCWVARVFFYPLPLLLVVGWFRRELHLLAPYVLAFSIAGLVVTLYQHLLQMGMAQPGVCVALAGDDCSVRWFFELGHITFPWIGVVMFGWFAFLAFLALRTPSQPRTTHHVAPTTNT